MATKITPQEAGRRGGKVGGKSKSAAKLAAARRNGFQRVEKLPAPESGAPDKAQPRAVLLLTITKEQQS